MSNQSACAQSFDLSMFDDDSQLCDYISNFEEECAFESSRPSCQYQNQTSLANEYDYITSCLNMKSPPGATDDYDISRPPCTYATGYNPPNSSLSMISPKYRQREEQRRAWNISLEKLSKIRDTEECLYRWVTISSVKKRLEQGAVHKDQLSYSRYDDNNLELESYIMFNNNLESSGNLLYEDSFLAELDFDVEDINEAYTKTVEALGMLKETSVTNSNPSADPTPETERFPSAKRSFDFLDECDVIDVLSQLDQPPIPGMLTCISNADEGEHVPKRLKTDSPSLQDISSVV